MGDHYGVREGFGEDIIDAVKGIQLPNNVLRSAVEKIYTDECNQPDFFW
jgi:hypothetical protein